MALEFRGAGGASPVEGALQMWGPLGLALVAQELGVASRSDERCREERTVCQASMKMLQQGKGKFDQRQVWSSIVRIRHLFAEHTISRRTKTGTFWECLGKKG